MSKSAPRIPTERIAQARCIFGGNVRRRRVAHGSTQAALAERVGIEPQSLQRIELGTGAPSFALIVALADALGISAGAFFRVGARLTKPAPGRPPARRR